jgi:hypothetical protein
MANPRHLSTRSTEHPKLDRPTHVEVSLPTTPQTGADEVYGPTLSVAVIYPDWRIEELARKYGYEDYEDRHERSFYHPYG